MALGLLKKSQHKERPGREATKRRRSGHALQAEAASLNPGQLDKKRLFPKTIKPLLDTNSIDNGFETLATSRHFPV